MMWHDGRRYTADLATAIIPRVKPVGYRGSRTHPDCAPLPGWVRLALATGVPLLVTGGLSWVWILWFM